MTTAKTARGRPVDPLEQQRRKDLLLDAASALLKKQSYRAMTIRQIASEAGMKSAMISYYFGSKEELFIALIERMSVGSQQMLEHLAHHDEPIRGFIHSMLTNMRQNRYLARLIHDEILSQSGALRERFMALFPKRIAHLLPKVIHKLQAKGEIKAELDPQWLAFSLMSLIIMPFVTEPVRKEAWHIEDETLFSDAWAEHIYQLFTLGAKQD